MKKLLIGSLLLGSIASFANPTYISVNGFSSDKTEELGSSVVISNPRVSIQGKKYLLGAPKFFDFNEYMAVYHQALVSVDLCVLITGEEYSAFSKGIITRERTQYKEYNRSRDSYADRELTEEGKEKSFVEWTTRNYSKRKTTIEMKNNGTAILGHLESKLVENPYYRIYNNENVTAGTSYLIPKEYITQLECVRK